MKEKGTKENINIFTTVSENCYKKDLQQFEFKELVKSFFPNYILTSDNCYFLHSYYLLGGGCRIEYILYDQGRNSNPKDRILIDSFDDDYRIAIYNILYQLNDINFKQVSLDDAKIWIKKQSFYQSDKDEI